MRKGKKEILALGLALSILCSSVNAGAYSDAGTTGSRLRCDTKRTVDSELVITACTDIKISGNTAAVDVAVSCELDVDSIDAELILQIYAESAWPKVESWDYTEKSCVLLESEDYTLRSPGTYRTKCVITAHRGSKTEKITIYSGEKVYIKPSYSTSTDGDCENAENDCENVESTQ